MPLRAEQLDAHLARGALSHLYVVCGDDALLGREALDALRAAARAQGFSERTSLHLDARSDWSALDAAGSELSLFATRRLVEARLATSRPGRMGGPALVRLAARKDPDTLTIVTMPALERATRGAPWVEALQRAGTWIEVVTVARERLGPWITARLARQGHEADAQAIALMAERFEGNLLAAQQEMDKLAMLHPPGRLTLEQVRAAVFDVARYDLFDVPAAMLAGDGARTLRLLAGLRAEGQPLPLLVWVVTEELRSLVRIRGALDEGRPAAAATRGMRLAAPLPLIERVLSRIDSRRLAGLLARCAGIDRMAKGLRAPGLGDDPWLELTDVALGLHPGPSATSARAAR